MLSRIAQLMSSAFSGRKQSSESIPLAVPEKKLPATSVDPLDSMTPDYSMAAYVGDAGPELFKIVGRELVDLLQAHGNLQPHETVLEVGCGIGRVAIPLTQYLKTGTYDGFDIVRHGIEWCQQKVTLQYPNFRFFHSDIFNKFYNPTGQIAASDFRFPFPDASFDFVFLTSVFTHMLPKDVERYTSEIGRVLKLGGRCFCTAYLISPQGLEHLDRGQSVKPFVRCEGGYWTASPGNHEVAIAYAEEYFLSLFRLAGMQIRRTDYGHWWRHEMAQDSIVAQKVGRPQAHGPA